MIINQYVIAFEAKLKFKIFIPDQINMTILGETIYKSDEIVSTMSCSHIYWVTNVIMNNSIREEMAL